MSDQATDATNDTSATGGEQVAATAAEVLLGGEKPAEGAAAPEAKTDTAKPEGEKPEEKPASDIPEKYEFKAPEGQELDTALLAEFEPLAREFGFSQENAQKLVDFYAAKILPRLEAKQAEAWGTTAAGWAESAKADKEYGGDGLAANLAVAKSALDKFGTPELVSVLNETRLGDHPELIRVFYRIGKAISDDSVMSSNGGSGGDRTAAQILFGN